MSLLEIRHLKLLVAVAEEGTVTRASHRLHLTQSALSHQLRQMEGRLDTQLFLRAGKKMVLTPAGERLLREGRRLLRELSQVEEQVRDMSLGETGKIRLSTECYTCYHWLPRAVNALRKQFPGTAIEIDVAATRQPVEALFKERIDVAILSRFPRDKRLRVQPLFRDEMVVIMRPDNPLASQKYVQPSYFADVSLLTYDIAREDNDLFRRLLIPRNVKPKEILQVGLTEAIIEMVRAGIGISVLAQWAIEPYLNPRSLIALPLTRRGLHRQWSAVTLKDGYHPDFLRKLLELLGSESASIFKHPPRTR